MRTIFLLVCLFFPFCIAFVVFKKHFVFEEPPVTRQEVPEQLAPPIVTHPIVDRINTRNANIRSFACKQFTVKAWKNGLRVKLTASLYYEKGEGFRMLLSSFLGKECDLGSNKELFWFWSKRVQPSALNYARHDEFHNTRLRTPFNPAYIVDSLGIGEIDSRYSIVETGEKLVAIEHSTNSIDEPIAKMVFINRETETLDGFIVTNDAGSPIVSGEVTKWDGHLPKQILYIWFEEDTSMLLEFNDVITNGDIDDKYWQLPPIQPQVDMAAGSAAKYFEY